MQVDRPGRSCTALKAREGGSPDHAGMMVPAQWCEVFTIGSRWRINRVPRCPHIHAPKNRGPYPIMRGNVDAAHPCDYACGLHVPSNVMLHTVIDYASLNHPRTSDLVRGGAFSFLSTDAMWGTAGALVSTSLRRSGAMIMVHRLGKTSCPDLHLHADALQVLREGPRR